MFSVRRVILKTDKLFMIEIHPLGKIHIVRFETMIIEKLF